jgi:hypothetical protein
VIKQPLPSEELRAISELDPLALDKSPNIIDNYWQNEESLFFKSLNFYTQVAVQNFIIEICKHAMTNFKQGLLNGDFSDINKFTDVTH